jgi:hypothetical protein
MSPGTDFSMYQKVASSTISNVPIDHSRDNHKNPSPSVYSAVLAANEQSKINAVKNSNKFFSNKSKIASNIAQTWTIAEKSKQTLPENSTGTRKASSESQKGQQWLLG